MDPQSCFAKVRGSLVVTLGLAEERELVVRSAELQGLVEFAANAGGIDAERGGQRGLASGMVPGSGGR